MANISITSVCNRDCRFCFARGDGGATGSGSVSMGGQQFEEALRFLSRSGIPDVRLLGGEPTLHRDFEQMLLTALSRGFRVMVFSGGLIPEAALRAIETTAEHAVSVVLNVEPCAPGEGLRPPRLADVCRRLGPRVMLGTTIHSPGISLDSLLDPIERFGLRSAIRLGLAHPTLSGSNEYLLPREYREVGRRVAEFAVLARARGVEVQFDCGWVPCMFPSSFLAHLGSDGANLGRRCGAIPDMLGDGSLVPCYPLADLCRVPSCRDHDARSVRQLFTDRLAVYRCFTLTRECHACEWRATGACTGGCLAAALQRRRRSGLSFVLSCGS